MKKFLLLFILFGCNNPNKEFTILHYKYVNTFTESTLYDDKPTTTNYQCVFVGINGVSYEVDTLTFPKFKDGDTIYIDDLIKNK